MSLRDALAPLRNTGIRAARAVARRRHRLPNWLNSTIDWVRWRVPDRWVRAITGRPAVVAPADPRLPVDFAWPPVPEADTRLLIGPANFAGQGHAWARAVDRELPDVGAVAFALDVEGGFDFPIDYSVPPAVYRRNHSWQKDQLEYAARFTHVILEAGRTLCADLHHLDVFREAAVLAERGVAVAMLSHGSDTRNPARHAARFAWSPFADPNQGDIPRLQVQAERFVQRLGDFAGPVFVSTPDLLDDLPYAVWCPVTVDPMRWVSTRPAMERSRPVVVHAPSHSLIKGSEHVERAMVPLHEAGLIEYRRVERIPAAEMPAAYGEADIVLDQFMLGSYGVAACEAMAAGRVVVGNVTTENRDRVAAASGYEVPIVQAEPEEIGAVVERLVAERDAARQAAHAGAKFVAAVHAGSLSAQVLAAFLGERA